MNTAERLNSGTVAAFGGVIAAIFASACCWLPLTLLAFGISGVAAGSFFQTYRVPFAIVTFLALGFAWYLTYRPRFRRSAVDEDSCSTTQDECGTCDSPTVKPVKRFNRVMLWIATPLALAFVFFPNYIGVFIGDGNSEANQNAIASHATTYELKIDGMHCEACAVTLTQRLSDIDGISGVRVDYEGKKAVVQSSLPEMVTEAHTRDAIEREGYNLTGITKRKE